MSPNKVTQPAESSGHPRLGSIPTNPEPPRILLLEDEPAVATALAIALAHRAAGVHVMIAPTCSDAWRILHATPCAALVVDVHLPDGDGLAFLENTRTTPHLRDTPALVITGSDKHDRVANDTIVNKAQTLRAEIAMKPDLVVPIRGFVDRAVAGCARIDPAHRIAAATDQVATRFGLRGNERTRVNLLVAGLSAREARERMGVSTNTFEAITRQVLTKFRQEWSVDDMKDVHRLIVEHALALDLRRG